MHKDSRPSTTSSGANHPAASVPVLYRTEDQIRELLQAIASQPAHGDLQKLHQAADVLDDLAEEMIGRNHTGDRALRQQIQEQRERFAAVPAPPS